MKENQNESKFPLNLQFFADPESTPEPSPEPTPAPQPSPEPELSAEERLQQIMVENAKLKKATDKATSEAADFKKKWKSALTEQEKADMEKAEKEAERQGQYESLLRENSINKFEKNFLKLGYSPELAVKASEAQFDNDTEALFEIQLQHQANIVKQKQDEWLKTRPNPQGGNGENGCTITKEQFNKFSYKQRIEFKTLYPETYKKYNS